jgi:DNA-binding transcriptional regulator PaaX
MNTKRSVADLILIALEKSVDGYVKFEDFIYNPEANQYGYPRIITKSKFSQAVKRLREGGWVEFVEEDKLHFKLSDKGRIKAIWESAKVFEHEGERHTVVIFDIPEKKHKTRDLLRQTLKQLDFVMWQESVWASKANCTTAVRTFIQQVGIQRWVRVFEAVNLK